MLPLLAIAGASSAIDKVATSAASLWKNLSSSAKSSSGKSAAEDPASFASVLAAQGTGAGSQMSSAAAALVSAAMPNASTGSSASQLVNRLA